MTLLTNGNYLRRNCENLTSNGCEAVLCGSDANMLQAEAGKSWVLDAWLAMMEAKQNGANALEVVAVKSRGEIEMQKIIAGYPMYGLSKDHDWSCEHADPFKGV